MILDVIVEDKKKRLVEHKNAISEEDLISATCKHYNIAADDAETLEELRDFLKDMFDEKILMHVD